jgi:hypothetical protein
MQQIFIHTSRAIFMQRILDGVCHGYTQWTSGIISMAKIEQFCRKFAENYSVFADRNQRARRKRCVLGNAKLLIFSKNEFECHWVLLVTPLDFGAHPAHLLEKLLNSDKQRITFDGFELVKQPEKKGAKKPTRLTWRMTHETYLAYRDSVIEAVRSGSYNAAERVLFSIFRTPGFSKIRSQVGHLTVLYKKEVAKLRRQNFPAPPKHLPYLRRIEDCGISLQVALARHKFAVSTAQQP